MNQHHIQEAYLKGFCVNGKVWAHDKYTQKSSPRPVRRCTNEEDFQSEQLEDFQNRMIESPGIKKLRKLISDDNISDDEFEIIMLWTALHCIRNEEFRNATGNDYTHSFYSLLKTEELFSNYYSHCFKYRCDEGKYLVTSDNPIVEFTVGEYYLRILALSPHELVLFSPIDGIPTHQEVEFSDMVNSMLWAGSFRQVFSNQRTLPIPSYEQNIRNWNLEPVLETMKFKIMK